MSACIRPVIACLLGSGLLWLAQVYEKVRTSKMGTRYDIRMGFAGIYRLRDRVG